MTKYSIDFRFQKMKNAFWVHTLMKCAVLIYGRTAFAVSLVFCDLSSNFFFAVPRRGTGSLRTSPLEISQATSNTVTG